MKGLIPHFALSSGFSAIAAKEFFIPFLSSAVTWGLTQFYYRKQRKAELNEKLFQHINDLSEKYVMLNRQYTDIVDKLNKVERENRLLKQQITCLRKQRKGNNG